jgi:hypothetical protein
LIFSWRDWSHHAFHGTQAEYNFSSAHSVPRLPARHAIAAAKRWALVTAYVLILSIAVIFLAVQLSKMNVSLLGFMAGRLVQSAISHEFGHVLQILIVDISPFKSGIFPGGPGFLDFVIKPSIIFLLLSLWLITYLLQVGFLLRFGFDVRLAMAAPRSCNLISWEK